MSENPFEIRANLLHQAQVILSENSHMKLHQDIERAKSQDGAVPEWQPYTAEDVIREATKLNAFVSSKENK